MQLRKNSVSSLSLILRCGAAGLLAVWGGDSGWVCGAFLESAVWGERRRRAEVHGPSQRQRNGLDFFTARYYGSALGRFISPDPANAGADATDPQSWNAYAYVRNNPLALVDPMGLWTFDAEGNAVEDENGACYEGGFGGSVTVVASAPPDVMPIFVSLPSLLSDTQQPAPTAP